MHHECPEIETWPEKHEWVRMVLLYAYLQQKMLLLGFMSPFCQICLNSSIQGIDGEAFFFQNWLYPKQKFKVKKKSSERTDTKL